MPPNNLSRFLDAQESCFNQVLAELQAGQKRSHWMWYIFPQIEGLGSSALSRKYSIKSLVEAEAYLAHPVLGARLVQCTELVLDSGKDVEAIFPDPDDKKLFSCMTLFSCCRPSHPIFQQALNQLFHGQLDPLTVERI